MTSSRLTRTAWLVVALLWPVALLNYLDRQMLAAMKQSVMAAIPTIEGDSQWGLLLGSFKWIYALLSPLGGYVADRFSKRLTIISSLFIWSVVTWLTGHCETYGQMLLTRAVMGVSEAFYIPAALALIADFHTGNTRSRAIGFHQMAIYVGIIIGGYSGHIADAPDYGWRWAFSAAGIAGIIYTVPMLLFLPNRHNSASVSQVEDQSAPLSERLYQLVTNRDFVFLAICFTLPAIAGWIVKDWMPAILMEQLVHQDGTPITQGEAGVTATLWTQIASILGALGGGWLADRWMRNQIRGRTFVSAMGLSLLIPALFGVSLVNSIPSAAAILIVFGIGWGFFDCNNMPILSQVVRPELRATGYGLMNFISISTGGFADYAFGYFKQQQVPLPMIFGPCALAALASIYFMLKIRPHADLAVVESAEDQEGAPA
ncbi:MAG: MFS transporter [Planctomycetaceae bacterium]